MEEAKDGDTSGQEPAHAVEESPVLPELPQEPRPKAFKLERKREKKKFVLFKRFAGRWPNAMRVDLFCLLAALLGLMSLSLPWIHEGSSHYEDDNPLWHYLEYGTGEHVEVFGLVVAALLVGSLLAVFSRVGGLVQLAGIISFLSISIPSGDSYAVGFYFGLVGSALGVVSLAFRTTFPIPDRFRTMIKSPADGKVTVNILSILGGVFGVLCLFLPWFIFEWSQTYVDFVDANEYTLYQFMVPSFSDQLTVLAAVCFLTGSLVSILTPLGFLGQLTGTLTFIYSMRSDATYADMYMPYGRYITESEYGIGLYLGCACILLVFGSMLLGWRLKLSKNRASILSSWPVHPSIVHVPEAPRSAKAVRWSGLRAALLHSIKAMFVAIVVLAVVVAAAGLAYVLPWSHIEIWIYGNDADSRLHVSIYIDGEGKVAEYIYYNTYYVKSFSVPAGDHRVGIDYGFPDDEHGTDVDGVLDWATSVKVRPLRTSALSVDLGFQYWERPVVALNASEYGNGWKLSVTEVNDQKLFEDSLYWYDLRTMLHDGTSTASWDPETSYLDNGSYCEQTFSPQLVGDITVTCTVVDLAGNGRLNVGDFILITSGTDYTFSSSVTYTLYMLYQPSGSLASEVVLQGRY